MGHDVQVGLPDRHKGEQHNDHGALGIPHTTQATGQNMVDAVKEHEDQDYPGEPDAVVHYHRIVGEELHRLGSEQVHQGNDHAGKAQGQGNGAENSLFYPL